MYDFGELEALPRLGLTMQICNFHGWGIHSMFVARRLLERRLAFPVPLFPAPPALLLPPQELALFAPIIEAYRQLAPELTAQPPRRLLMGFPVVHVAGNSPAQAKRSAIIEIGAHDFLRLVFEQTALEAADIDYIRRFKRVIAISRWNADILKAHGIDNVALCHEGIDTAIFHPGPRGTRFGTDRFVIFSGGKAEFRKGQDIVLAAFRRFHQRHKEALLVTMWNSPWPDFARGLAESPLGTGAPALGAEGKLRLADWAAAYGIAGDAFIDLGAAGQKPGSASDAALAAAFPNRGFASDIADILRSVDVALFPNRSEAGTNRVAMECLACGVPTVLADNTGQHDLIAVIPCFPLRAQCPVATALPGTQDWREPSVDEIVAILEQVYTDRAAARRRGLAAAAAMAGWTWQQSVDREIAHFDLAAP